MGSTKVCSECKKRKRLIQVSCIEAVCRECFGILEYYKWLPHTAEEL